MGKKDKNKKKGKGAEKTAAKTEKKLTLKQKKELTAIGEVPYRKMAEALVFLEFLELEEERERDNRRNFLRDDIEKIVTEIENEEKKRLQVVEHVLPPPSRRVNCTLTPHPDKDELILFGGEYFNGRKTCLYNELFFYNISRNEWLLVKAPGAPPPRCGHQALALSAGKGQLWVFGGEFASPTQAQFYHYKDLWVYHMATKKWEKISSPGGPTARSGHRMVCVKKQLIVFGGFHDNLRDYKYFNDVYAFNLENYTWKKLEPTGTPPPARSGCQMAALSDGRVLIYGGYSKEKIKKDVDKGIIHSDMFFLTPEKNDVTGTKWKWVSTKYSGVRMSPRCGTAMAVTAGNKAYTFGGVFDIEESEEDLAGTFFNDLQVLELDKAAWRTVALSGKKDTTKVKRRRRKEKGEAEDEGEMEDSGEESEDEDTGPTTLADDGVFKVTVGPAPAACRLPGAGPAEATPAFSPSPRMNCCLAVKHGALYLYGGLVEDGDKQLTLADFYSLDLKKLDEWRTIVANDLSTQEWVHSDSGSDSESDEEDGESTDEEADEEGDDEDDDEDDDTPMEVD